MGKSPTLHPQAEPHSLGHSVVASYSASIAHHGNVIHTFSSQFVSVFAWFNAGAFSASVAVIPTPLGRAAIVEHSTATMWILILFAAGFIFASALMAIVFQYSLNKY